MEPSLNLLKKEKEQVAVIGSGITGCLSALELTNHGYKVSMFEEQSSAFSGSSARAIQAHLGGLYSASPNTARECLDSAIEFKKALPFALNRHRALFLVANKSEVNLEEYVAFYQNLTDYYESLPGDQHVFGSPQNFYSLLEAKEVTFAKNIEGGIATQEPGLDMPNARKTLLWRLASKQVTIHTSTEVIGAEPKNNGFDLVLQTLSSQEKVHFAQVINAGSYKARLLDHQLGDRTAYSLYLETWNTMENQDGQPPLPAFYVVRGGFMHHSPIGKEGLVNLITANNQGSYLDQTTYDSQRPSLPLEWMDILQTGAVPDATSRQEAILEFANDEFLSDSRLRPLSLTPGVSVSYSSHRSDRTRRAANQVLPGWQTVVATKATNALQLAREAVENALSYSGQR